MAACGATPQPDSTNNPRATSLTITPVDVRLAEPPGVRGRSLPGWEVCSSLRSSTPSLGSDE